MANEMTVGDNFNPRSREGSDLPNRILFLFPTISIHAPAKGATVKSWSPINTELISIHAPAKGATAFCCLL